MYRSPRFRTIALGSEGWVMEGVRVLVTPVERFVGLRDGNASPVMLLTRSIHTVTMTGPISVIVADLEGVVLGAGVVEPHRFVGFKTRRWVIEAEFGVSLPSPGSRIVASTMPSRCPEH